MNDSKTRYRRTKGVRPLSYYQTLLSAYEDNGGIPPCKSRDLPQFIEKATVEAQRLIDDGWKQISRRYRLLSQDDGFNSPKKDLDVITFQVFRDLGGGF